MNYAWIDQYGQVVFAKDKRELLEKLGYSSGQRMYIDTKQGTQCLGYVIGERWYARYVLSPL